MWIGIMCLVGVGVWYLGEILKRGKLGEGFVLRNSVNKRCLFVGRCVMYT